MRTTLFALAVAVLLPLLALPPAFGQSEGSGEPPMQSIQISGMRDPALLPYADVVMLRKVFSAASDGTTIRPGIKVSSRRDGQPVKNLRVTFAAEGRETELPLKSGYVLLSELPETGDAQAEFLTNQRKGSLRMEILLTVELKDAQHFSLGELTRAIDDGKRIRRSLLPWYLRLIVPKFDRAAVCFADAGGAATIVQGERRHILSASSADDCLLLPVSNASSETVFDLNKPALYVRLL